MRVSGGCSESTLKKLSDMRGVQDPFQGNTRWFTDLYVNFVLMDSADLFETLKKVV
jgi:hypothetical protein